MTFFLPNRRNAKPIVRREVGKQIDGILTTHNSTNEKENAEPSRGLDDDNFYVKIAEILKSAKPDNVEVMVRVIVEMMAQYNGTQDPGNKVGASHGEEKGVDAGNDTQGEGSFGRGGVPLDQGEFVESQETFSGKGKAGEQQGPDLQTERLASRHRSHSRVGPLAFRGPPDHGRAMRHQLLNPVPDPWSQI